MLMLKWLQKDGLTWKLFWTDRTGTRPVPVLPARQSERLSPLTPKSDDRI